MRKLVRAIAVTTLLAGPIPAQQTPPSADSDVVVQALPLRCQAQPGAALDAVVAAAPMGKWVVTVRDRAGGDWRLSSTRSDWWTRVSASLGSWVRYGYSLTDFVFRTPLDGNPACVGRRGPSPIPDEEGKEDDVVVVGRLPESIRNGGIGQQVQADSYRCHTLRFTAYLATRQASGLVWMNGGYGRWTGIAIRGSHRWRALSIVDGPVGWWYPWTGFGVWVEHGDAWLYQPKLETLPDDALTPGQRAAEKLCRDHRPMAQVAALIDRSTPRH